jgi:hypothetical protein
MSFLVGLQRIGITIWANPRAISAIDSVNIFLEYLIKHEDLLKADFDPTFWQINQLHRTREVKTNGSMFQ